MLEKSFVTKLPWAHKSINFALKLTALIPMVLVTIFVALRIYHITSFSIWGGEAFSMIGVRQDWSGMFSYVIADIVHPPLFYILLKLWIALGGESLLWLKLFPVLTSLALLVPFYLLCRELSFQLLEMSLALLLAGVNGYLIHYAQELRMYSLFTFLTMCSFWLFIRLLKSPGETPRELLWLTFVNLLAIYSHYYGWLAVGMEVLFLLIWRRDRLLKFSLSGLFLLLVFSPWAYFVIGEAQSIGGLERNLDWIPKPGLIDIVNFYASLNGPLGSRYLKILGLLIFGLPLASWFWQIIRSNSKRQGGESIAFSWLAILSFLPVFAIFLISQRLEQAVWIDRYFIFIAVPYLMLVASAAYRLKPAWVRHTWIGLIVIWSLVAGFNDLRTNRMAWASPQLGSRVKWDVLAQQLIEAETNQSGLINVYTLTVISKGHRTGDYASSTSLDYFLDSYGENKFQMAYAKDVQTLLKHSPLQDHFWIVFFELAESPQPHLAAVLEKNGYRVGDPISFQQMHNRIVLLPVWHE